MPAGPEAHALGGIIRVRLSLVIGALETLEVDEDVGRRRLAGERREAHTTGHGLTSQISAAYSAIVRSLENLPEPAMLRMAFRVQPWGSA